jgi:predicted transporter
MRGLMRFGWVVVAGSAQGTLRTSAPADRIGSMMTTSFRSEFLDMRWGIALALLTLLFGFGLGGAFGFAEDAMKDGLRARGAAVVDTVYEGDAEGPARVAGRSWTYFKRAHLHANGLGTSALALIALLAALPLARRVKRAAALALGGGGLGYGLYWLLAGVRAPALGGTHAAKESLAWLAIPSSALVILATLVCLWGVLVAARGRS